MSDGQPEAGMGSKRKAIEIAEPIANVRKVSEMVLWQLQAIGRRYENTADRDEEKTLMDQMKELQDEYEAKLNEEQKEQRQLSGTPADGSGAFLRSLFSLQSLPPSLESFPMMMPILKRPLPIRSTSFDCLKTMCNSEDHELLPSLVKVCDGPTPDPEPAYHLADTLYNGIFSDHKEDDNVEQLIMMQLLTVVRLPMRKALSSLRQDYRFDDGNADPSTATSGTQSLDLRLFLDNVLMWKAVVKRGGFALLTVSEELRKKANDWIPDIHGERQYMVCCGMKGRKLKFYILERGGGFIRPISEDLDLSSILDRIKAIHYSLVALDITLRQFHHEVPSNLIPMYTSVRKEYHTTLHYGDKSVRKAVIWGHGPTSDEHTLAQVYSILFALPHGEGLVHPRGLLLPIEMPSLSERPEWWSVTMPMARKDKPSTVNQLRQFVVDVLHGLKSLHDIGLVHRDVRGSNILQSGNSFVLIDYELAGLAGEIPVFANTSSYQPLPHWPQECRTPGAPYSAAADLHGFGRVLLTYGSLLPQSAQSLPPWLTHLDHRQRPTAGAALAWVEANWHVVDE